MAALNPNSTARYKWFYTINGKQHSAQLRASAPFSPSDMGAFLTDWYGNLESALFNGTLNEVHYSAIGTDVFNPVTTGVEGLGIGGGGTGGNQDVPVFLDFVGRSTGGRRVRLAQFGLIAVPTDYRYTGLESAGVAACVNLLNTTANAGLAVDGLKAIWKPYANAGFNAYWQRKVRS